MKKKKGFLVEMTDKVKVLKTSMCYIRLLKKEHAFQKERILYAEA